MSRPNQLSYEELSDCFRRLVLERSPSPSNYLRTLNAVIFFYRQVLDQEDFYLQIPLPKKTVTDTGTNSINTSTIRITILGIPIPALKEV